jgi:hypothetical protein
MFSWQYLLTVYLDGFCAYNKLSEDDVFSCGFSSMNDGECVDDTYRTEK